MCTRTQIAALSDSGIDESALCVANYVANAVSAFGPISRVAAAIRHQGRQSVVQTQIEFGMVVRVGGELFTILGSHPCPLAVVQSTTSACIAQVQQSLSMATRNSLYFKTSTRAAVTDSASSLPAVEQHIARQRRQPPLQSLHIKCQVHKTSTMHGQVFSFIDPTVSGMVRAALAVRNGASMIRFREAVKAEVTYRLDIIEGVSSGGA